MLACLSALASRIRRISAPRFTQRVFSIKSTVNQKMFVVPFLSQAAPVHSGMHGVESACYLLSHSRLSISRRRVPGPRAVSASAAVSTHSRARPWPRAARTRSLTHLLACHVSDRAPFSLQTPVERSERVAGCWAVRARAHPLSLGVWHFTLRFVLPGSWVGHPSATAAERRGWAMQSPSGPKVYPKQARLRVYTSAVQAASPPSWGRPSLRRGRSPSQASSII